MLSVHRFQGFGHPLPISLPHLVEALAHGVERAKLPFVFREDLLHRLP